MASPEASLEAACDVAVSGIGCICALGAGYDACLAALERPRVAPAPPRRFNTAHEDRYPVFEVAEEHLAAALAGNPLAGEELTRTARLGLAAGLEAVADAGLAGDLPRLRVGVAMGTTTGSTLNDEAFYRAFRAGARPNPAPARAWLRSNPAAVLARAFGCQGPVQTVVNACTSGADAIGVAAGWLRAGLCDVALAGGADELFRGTYLGFISLMISDSAPCRPFDAQRRGLNLGEGAAVLVLERADAANATNALRARGARPRALLRGYGTACDAFHLTKPHPQARGLERALDHALAQAGATSQQIACINAHGTGTQDNDRVEAGLFAARLPGIPFISTKGHTGHTLGAAGALEAAFCIGALERGLLPASAGLEIPDPELPARARTEPTRLAGSLALSTSLAFGGNNAVLVFEKREREEDA